jgi:hypothetical protein
MRTTPKRPARTEAIPPAQVAVQDDVRSQILPIGHYVGAQHRIDELGTRRQVRRGAIFHDLTEDQFAVWVAAHGTPAAIEQDAVWHRRSIEEHPPVSGLPDASGLIDGLLDLELLVEVAPGDNHALDFARSHRLVPLMLGLGNGADQPGVFGIGFIHQPVLQVSHAIYDLWQWSAMDDSLWATCENAADVARRAGSTDPEFVDPASLLTGFLGSLPALLLANAAYLDADFRLKWPETAAAASFVGTRHDG